MILISSSETLGRYRVVMEQRISLITLGVADLSRSRTFYEDGLGFVRSNAHEEVAFYQLAGFVLALWSRSALAADAGLPDGDGRGFGGFTLAHNVTSPTEVDAVLSQAEHAGARILKPGTPTAWGGYSGYFADPDEHLWEVAHNPSWVLHPDGRTTVS